MRVSSCGRIFLLFAAATASCAIASKGAVGIPSTGTDRSAPAFVAGAAARGQGSVSSSGTNSNGVVRPERETAERSGTPFAAQRTKPRISNLELSSADQALVNRKRRVPRRDFKFKAVPSDFVVKGDDGQRYMESMIMLTVIGALAGVLSLLAWPIFTIPRSCCGAFGGSRPRTENGGEKYSSGARTRHVVTVVFLALCVVGGCYLEFSGSNSLSEGFDDFFASITGAGDNLKAEAQRISTKLVEAAALQRQASPQSAPSTEAALAATADLTQSVDETQESVSEVEGFASSVDNVRRIFVYASLGLAILCVVVLGGAAASLGSRCLGLSMMHMCFFAAFVTWLSFGMYLSVGTATADLCVDLEGFIVSTADTDAGGGAEPGSTTLAGAGEGPGDSGRGIEEVLGCVGNGTAAGSFNFAEDEVTRTIQDLNDELVRSNYTGGVFLDPTSDNYTELTANLTRVREQLGKNGFIDAATPEAAVDRMQGNIDAGAAYLEVLLEIRELLKCGIVRDAYESIEEAICGKMLRALDYLMIGAGLIALALLGGIIIGARGSKRFPRANCYASGEKQSPEPSKTGGAYDAPEPMMKPQGAGQYIEMGSLDDLSTAGHSRRMTVSQRDGGGGGGGYAPIEDSNYSANIDDDGDYPGPTVIDVDSEPVSGFTENGQYVAPPAPPPLPPMDAPVGERHF